MAVDEHRAINFDHVATVNLDVFGICQPPVSLTARNPKLIPFALRSLREAYSADFAIHSEDGRVMPCSRMILERRWAWFKEKFEAVTESARDIASRQGQDNDTITRVNGNGNGNGEHSPDGAGKRISGTGSIDPLLEKWKSDFDFRPGSLRISEPYPVCKAFLEYIYTQDLATPLQLKAPMLSALLIFGKQYHLPDLVDKVIFIMHERLNDQNAMGVYEIATLCGCRGLQVRALIIVLVSSFCHRPDEQILTWTVHDRAYNGNRTVAHHTEGTDLDLG